jgi:hypothetical protein
VPAPAAPLDAAGVCRPGLGPLAWRELTALVRDALRWIRFGARLCTTTGGSSFEPALAGEAPPAVCAELSALQMFRASVLTAPRHTSLGHPFEVPTDIPQNVSILFRGNV